MNGTRGNTDDSATEEQNHCHLVVFSRSGECSVSKNPSQEPLHLGTSQARVDSCVRTFVRIDNLFHYMTAVVKFGKLVEVAAARMIKGDMVLGQ